MSRVLNSKENPDKILYKGEWYLTVSKEFLLNSNLSRDARFLLIVLKSFTNDKNKEAFPSRKYLCKILGCTQRTLTNTLNELQDFGYLTKRQERKSSGKFDSNIYTITEKTNRDAKWHSDKNLPDMLKPSVGFSYTNNKQYNNDKDWSNKL